MATIDLNRLLRQQRRLDAAQLNRAYKAFFASVDETEHQQRRARRLAIQSILRRAGEHHV